MVNTTIFKKRSNATLRTKIKRILFSYISLPAKKEVKKPHEQLCPAFIKME
jgi:hypothetical protein